MSTETLVCIRNRAMVASPAIVGADDANETIKADDNLLKIKKRRR